jgi:iron complex outermembrane receptor protein
MLNRKQVVCAFAQVFGGLAVCALAPVALAQQQDTQKLERVEVTGSSIKRIDAETSSPVTILRKEDLEKLGVTSAAELLQKVSASNTGGFTLQQGVGSSLAGFSGASLRGLSSARTLVLLNGRRLPGFATNSTAVDLNLIPFEALERVEVLRDGASAVYGTDAIGGVINFITRKDYNGIIVSGRTDQTESGGGDSYTANATIGFGDLAKDRFNIFASFSAAKSDVLRSKERSFAKTGIFQTGPFSTLSQFSYNTPVANIYDGDFVNGRFVPVGALIFSNPGAPACDPSRDSYVDYTFPPFNATSACIYDFTARIDLLPKQDRLSAISRATLQLSSDIELFAELTYAKTKTKYAISETPTGTFTPSELYMLPSNPFYPTAYLQNTFGYNGPIGMFWRIREGGGRTNQADVDQYRVNLGSRGVLLGWDYDAAFSNAKSKYDESYTDGYFSRRRLQALLDAGRINPFAENTGAQLQALNSAKILASVRQATLDLNEFQAKASRELGSLAGGAMGVAVGLNWRQEKLKDESNAELASGDVIGGTTIPSTSGKRTSTGVFGEVVAPFAKGWEATAAARYDTYDGGVGGTFNPKLGLKWSPSNQFALRTSLSSGFRAPSITDLFGGTSVGSSANFVDPVLCPGGVGTAGNCRALQRDIKTESSTAVKPEKARGLTAGMIIEPSRNFSTTLDFYYINVKGVIGELGGNFILGGYKDEVDGGNLNGPFGQYIQRATGCGQPVCGITAVVSKIGNWSDLWTSGVDLSMKYRFPKTDVGSFQLGYDATYVNRYDTRLSFGGQKVWGEGFSANTGDDPLIRLRTITTLGWERGPLSGALVYNWQNGYTQQLTGLPTPQKVSSYETFDLQVGYTGIKGLRLSAGVRNVLDRNPPFTIAGAGVFQVGFDPAYADPRGRTAYISGSYEFK